MVNSSGAMPVSIIKNVRSRADRYIEVRVIGGEEKQDSCKLCKLCKVWENLHVGQTTKLLILGNC